MTIEITSYQQAKTSSTNVCFIPDIWLNIAPYLDAVSALRLCSLNRTSRQFFNQLPYFWQYIYKQNFSRNAAEMFWLAAYCSRMDGCCEATPKTRKIDWRHALIARKRTEWNWRHGRGIENFCTIRSSNIEKNTCMFLGFTPHHLLLQDKLNNQYVTTTVDTLRHSNLFQNSPGGHCHSDILDDLPILNRVYCHLLESDTESQAFCQFVHRSSNRDDSLPFDDILFISKLDRWIICRRINTDIGADYYGDWLLLDVHKEYPPQVLKMPPFDLGASNNDHEPVDDSGSTVQVDSMIQSADNVCITCVEHDTITIFSARFYEERLYWRTMKIQPVLSDQKWSHPYSKEVLFADNLPQAGIRLLRSGCIHFPKMQSSKPTASSPFCMSVRVLSERYISMRVTRRDAFLYFMLMLNIAEASNQVWPFKHINDLRCMPSVVTFPHGWLSNGLYDIGMHLSHRQLFATLSTTFGSNQDLIQLRRYQDGSVLKEYIIPRQTLIRHVLGDLFLLELSTNSGETLSLFDAFTGTFIRDITLARCRSYFSELRFSPLYYIHSWEKGMSLHGKGAADHFTLSDPSDNPTTDATSLRISWIDFMPNLAD
jgi:hypothetical protein